MSQPEPAATGQPPHTVPGCAETEIGLHPGVLKVRLASQWRRFERFELEGLVSGMKY